MSQIKQLSLFAILLLVSFLQIQCIVGRHLVLELDHKERGTNVNKAAVADTQSPPTPSVAVGGTKAPPPKNENDFRPTAPGHSPGAGHSLQN
ncbi:C-TERMINALLY ENCODED PEPTIDE 5 [Hibiscus trionum]|uniref:C-TERMINALLY ENCODED PEPTIDE 5 n=1 Tax=Hibiscus trionum TaxID=183268 RepID=A0A9W7HZZ6_HIBTR|nr:C-TERMINALLY ENCODED PEPTIDE 5 [Hibiscus trionum]